MTISSGKFGVIGDTHVDFKDLKPNVAAEDIAFGQCNIQRYAGATLMPMSVATHSVVVGYVMSALFADEVIHKTYIDAYQAYRTISYAIAHDWPEILVGDMPAPAKSMVPEFIKLERSVFQKVFSPKLGDFDPNQDPIHADDDKVDDPLLAQAVHCVDKHCWNLEEPIFQQCLFAYRDNAALTKEQFIKNVAVDHDGSGRLGRAILMGRRDECLFFITRWLHDVWSALTKQEVVKHFITGHGSTPMNEYEFDSYLLEVARNIRTILIHQVRYVDYVDVVQKILRDNASFEDHRQRALAVQPDCYTFDGNTWMKGEIGKSLNHFKYKVIKIAEIYDDNMKRLCKQYRR